MKKRNSNPWPPALIAIALIALLAWTLLNNQKRAATVARGAEELAQATGARSRSAAGDEQAALARGDALEVAIRTDIAAWKKLLEKRLTQRNARVREAIMVFKDEEGYRRFRGRAAGAGIQILATIDPIFAARVRYDSLDGLSRDIINHVRDFTEIGGNYYVEIPAAPPVETRTERAQVPVRDTLLSTLGYEGDNSQWGRGVTIAILDSGIVEDPTFGVGRVRVLDIGLGTTVGKGSEDGHGTAVAALAAGAARDARGIAPAADILSIRVTADDSKSDMFTISQAIVAAVDAGARVLNISLGGYEGGAVLTRAIDYASAQGAVIVAASGNDQAAQLALPAADPRVVSVGATDAKQQQVLFSNSGPQLQITAPGYGVQTAWVDGERVYFSGTSASAPIVAGAIAAVMSEVPGRTAGQAWDIVRMYVDDAGALGPDADYGAGVLDLGWLMDRGNAARVETAIASHYYNADEGAVEVVVQNRGGFGLAGIVLEAELGGNVTSYMLPWLDVGATTVVKISIDQAAADANGQVILRTHVINPGGLPNKTASSGSRASVLTLSPRP